MKKKTANLYIDGYNFYYSIINAANDNPKFGMHVGHAWCNFKKLAEEQLLDHDEQLEKIVYCTADVGECEIYEEEGKNQELWLNYLEEYIPNIEIRRGYHRGMTQKEKKAKKTKAQNALEKLKDKVSNNIFRTISHGINPKTRKDVEDAKNVLKILVEGLEKRPPSPNPSPTKDILKYISRLIKPERKEKMTDVNIAIEMVADSFCDKNMDIAILISEDSDFLPAVEALYKKLIDVRVYIPLPKKDNQWNNLTEGKYKVTAKNLTADMLTESVLPYHPCQKENNKESWGSEKKLPDRTRWERYQSSRDRFWTYDAIKIDKKYLCDFSKERVFCNITADEEKRLERTNSFGWNRFDEAEIPVYDYQSGKWLIHEKKINNNLFSRLIPRPHHHSE